MINYDSPIAVNDELCRKLSEKLIEDFEDALYNYFSEYTESDYLDRSTSKEVYKLYVETRDAYIESLAALIMYPDSLDWVNGVHGRYS